jgi:Zn ribbon nucleic-acid-binding protein
MISQYSNQRASLLTKHGKEAVIAKVMHESLGLEIIHIDSFDTDLFGTFTRDIARQGNQLEAARAKAIKGAEIADTKLGLASEGLFTGDPFLGTFPWNNELVILVDTTNKVEITGFSSNYAQSYSALISADGDIEEHLKKAAFPMHHLVLRPNSPESKEFRKGISTRDEFDELTRYFFKKSESGKVFLENDLRAFSNPTRMENIRTATLNLAEKIRSICPACRCPGFWITNTIPGLHCVACGNQTKEIKAKVYVCKKCSHVEMVKSKDLFADQGKCDFCNP